MTWFISHVGWLEGDGCVKETKLIITHPEIALIEIQIGGEI